jgi:SEC-C motif domain protein
MKPIHANDPCPCGGTRYAGCCGRFHAGAETAPTAEWLMRSRYSAYALELGAYLLTTWHPSTRPAEPPHFEPGLKWLGLEVREHRVIDAEHAEVAFVARSKLGGRAHRLVERSRFVRDGGSWFYLAGDVS